MVDEKEEIYVVVYEMCPGGIFSRRRDWAWVPAPSPEIALQIFKEKYAYLTKEYTGHIRATGICMLYVAKVIV